MKTPMRRNIIVVVFFGFIAAGALCFAAYVGHVDDSDVKALLAAYPQLKGTALDSCATCHLSGSVGDSKKVLNNCDYCHAIYTYGEADIIETLNAFGKDYRYAQRKRNTFELIAGKDSDGDGYTNEAEIAALTNPGAEGSSPALKPAPAVVFSLADMLEKLEPLKQTVFINSHKSPEGDNYYTYRGFRVSDILELAGAAPDAASIDVVSVDGYTKTFTMEQVKKTYAQGAPVFGLDAATLWDCGWVHYDGEGIEAGKPLPDAMFILAFEQDGEKYRPTVLDTTIGRIKGAGPFRTIMPQSVVSPPDLSEFAPAHCPQAVDEAYRYNTTYEKNADFAVKAVVAIRVNPLPEGARDFDWRATGGWDYADGEKIVVYGAITPGD